MGKRKYEISVPLEMDTGGIVRVVDVIDCVERHTSKRFEKGNVGWVLANPHRLNFRPCKGALNLFRPNTKNDSSKCRNVLAIKYNATVMLLKFAGPFLATSKRGSR